MIRLKGKCCWLVSSACGTFRLISNVLCTNILKIEGGHCFYVLPAIARSPICCLFPTSNRADARMFPLPCAYSCPGIYNAITAMAVSSSFNCFKLYKTYIHPHLSLPHSHTCILPHHCRRHHREARITWLHCATP